MALLIPNLFSSWKLSPEEEESGSIFTLLQIYVIQNKISEAATAKVNQVFDPLNPADFGIQTAYQQGRMEALQDLLLTGEETQRTIYERNQILASQSNNSQE